MRVKEGKGESKSAFFSASQMREVTFKNWRVKRLRRRRRSEEEEEQSLSNV